MTGEDVFKLLQRLDARGEPARTRERQLKRIAQREGISSDALRAKARRYARRMGLAYPLMRRPSETRRDVERAERRAARDAWKDERLRIGAEALARGADWAEIARLFGIATAEGAAQWWRRNHPEAQASRKRTKARRRRRARRTSRPAASMAAK